MWRSMQHVWSNWCVRYHLINWSDPAHNLIWELHRTRAAAAHMGITCKQRGDLTDQNKWCFGWGAGGCRATFPRCWEGATVVITESKWGYEAPVGPRHQSSKLPLISSVSSTSVSKRAGVRCWSGLRWAVGGGFKQPCFQMKGTRNESFALDTLILPQSDCDCVDPLQWFKKILIWKLLPADS